MRSVVSMHENTARRGTLKISVDWDEPGTIQIPWLYKRNGVTFFSTETLRPRSQPFHLVRELIRGQLSRILKKVYDWEMRGLVIPPVIRQAIRNGVVRTSEIMTADMDAPDYDDQAVTVFEMLVFLSQLLLDQFIEQSLLARKLQTSNYPVSLGLRSGRVANLIHFNDEFPEFADLFQSWNPGYTWRHLEPEEGKFRWDILDRVAESAQEKNLQLYLGPIVRWDRFSLPEWLLNSLDDPYTIRQALFRYANAMIERYQSVNHWVVSSGIPNEFDYILVSKRIEWADAMARMIHSKNPNAEVLVGIERPWGDSLRFNSEMPPIELADSLARNRFFDGFLLSIDFGLSPEASLPRDAFELNNLLDQWSFLGRPLYFSFSVPSQPPVDTPLWETPSYSEAPWNLQTQQETVHHYFLSFLTRKMIRGIFWSRYEDIPVKKNDLSLIEESKEGTKSYQELSEELHEDEETKTKIRANDLNNDSELVSPVSNDDLLTSPEQDPHAEIIDGEAIEISSLEDQEYVVALSFPHSGLVTTEGNPKPAFRKLAALKNAYLG